MEDLSLGSPNKGANMITDTLSSVEYIPLKDSYKVWTKRVGEGPVKILTLHGGPGCNHEYLTCMHQFLPLDQFQVIYYDQLGSCYSDQPEEEALWRLDRFVDEVEQVRKHLNLNNFYLFGHSWGGLLAIEYALRYQSALKGLIISNMTASVKSYTDYLNHLRTKLPLPIQQKLKNFEDKGDFFHPEYENIMMEEVYSKFLCRIHPFPEAFLSAFSKINKTVYHCMQGPNEFVFTGNLKDWDRWSDLHKITIPTLLIGARYDTMNPADIEKMGGLMPNATVEICENGSHGAMYDDQDRYFEAFRQFLFDREYSTPTHFNKIL